KRFFNNNIQFKQSVHSEASFLTNDKYNIFMMVKGDIMDLFNIQVNEEKLHPNYINIYRYPDLRKKISNRRIGYQDRDNKLVKEFQTTFNSSCWELNLHTCMNNL